MFRCVSRRAWQALARPHAVWRAAPALSTAVHKTRAYRQPVAWLRKGPGVAVVIASSAALIGGAAWCEEKASKHNDERLTLAASEQKLAVVEQLLKRSVIELVPLFVFVDVVFDDASTATSTPTLVTMVDGLHFMLLASMATLNWHASCSNTVLTSMLRIILRLSVVRALRTLGLMLISCI